MILIFIYTHDLIQKGVKAETSILGVRRNAELQNGQMVPQFENLVFDEAYEVMFRRLFNDARAEVVQSIPAHYLKNMPTDLEPLYREFPDFSEDRDFLLYIQAGDDFPPQYRKSIDSKIEMFLIDYICYRWFETKSPADAKTYFSRLEKTKSDILGLLAKRTREMRRLPSFP